MTERTAMQIDRDLAVLDLVEQVQSLEVSERALKRRFHALNRKVKRSSTYRELASVHRRIAKRYSDLAVYLEHEEEEKDEDEQTATRLAEGALR